MALASIAETVRANTPETGLFTVGRYRPENPLRLRQTNYGNETVVRRVSDNAQQDRYVRTIDFEGQTPDTETSSRASLPAPVAEILNDSGFARLSTVVTQAGAGTLRAGALFGAENPLSTLASSFGAALQTPDTTETIRSAAAWYRQAGPLRLNQGAALPETALYRQQETQTGANAVFAALAGVVSGLGGYQQQAETEPVLYASTGSVLEQTPRLLNALFA